jgi:hypothetical protein
VQEMKDEQALYEALMFLYGKLRGITIYDMERKEYEVAKATFRLMARKLSG